MLRLLFSVFAFAIIPSMGAAHEFWLEAADWQINPGGRLVVTLHVGEKLKGPSHVYNPSRFARFEIFFGTQRAQAPGRMGDDPALSATIPGEGLAIVVHETTDNTVTYREWDKFVSFVEHKGFEGALEAHDARGLPETQFSESYRRYGKALIAVGNGRGSDRTVGLTTEIVLERNPYTDDISAGLPIRVLHKGRPRAAAQLELFERDRAGSVTVRKYRTNDAGLVTVPVRSGHMYLADAVVLEDTGNDTAQTGPVWRSLWASSTFYVP